MGIARTWARGTEPMADVVLCADLGTQSLRVGAVTAQGALKACARVPIAAVEPHPGWSIVDPEHWWSAFAETTADVLARLEQRHPVRGVCVCGPTRSQVLVDRGGRPLGPALLFRDRRAVEEAADVARYFVAGNPADAITPFHPLARLAWFARREPALFDRVDAVLEAKDFLNLRLTCARTADTVTYSRFDTLHASQRPLPDWLARCVDLLGLRRVSPWSAVGAIAAREAPFDRLDGVPVFAGTVDTWAAAVGSGVIRAGQGYDVGGTSEAAGLITGTRVIVPGLVSLKWGERVHQVGGPTQAGADCAAWCHRTFRVTGGLARAVERAGSLAPDDDRPLFLPYLDGERAPVWRADVRGSFDGVTRAHDADDFLWSVLEGVALAVRDIVSRAVEGAAEPLAHVRVAGGGARSNAWCQMKSDVLRVPVMRSAQPETGLIGAAIAAAVGLRWHPTLAAAVDAMCAVDRVFEPRAALAQLYAQRAQRYARAKEHALADVARPLAKPAAADAPKVQP